MPSRLEPLLEASIVNSSESPDHTEFSVSLSQSLLSKCKLGITSMSLGRAWAHQLLPKVDAAAAAGFEGIEVFCEDLEYLAESLDGNATNDNMVRAAQQVRRMTDKRSLRIICLQPFWHYEGLLDRAEHDKRIEKLLLWFRLLPILGTDLIVIPTNSVPPEQVTEDLSLICADLLKVAKMGATQTPPVRFAYEPLCWGTRVDSWAVAWDIVRYIDMPNFGICLDSFNLVGREYADPTRWTGLVSKKALERYRASMLLMGQTIEPKKLFLVQLADAERLDEPLVEGHPFYDSMQPARMSWSRNARLFPGEADRSAYLPVIDTLGVMLRDLDYKGWVVMEVFSRTLTRSSADVPFEHAYRGVKAWRYLIHQPQLSGSYKG